MSELFQLDEYNINFKQVRYIYNCLKEDKIIACPSSTGYSLICLSENRKGVKALQKCFMKEKRLPVALFASVADMAKNIAINQSIFKLIKKNSPSSCTFVVKVPPSTAAKLLYDRRQELGVRFPEEQIMQELLHLNDNMPLVAFGAVESASDDFSLFAEELIEILPTIELLVIDFGQPVIIKPSTIINCCNWPVEIIRAGSYDLIGV